MSATYKVEIDFEKLGDFSHGFANVTAYVINLDWTNGVQTSYEEFAPPAQLNLKLAAPKGEFLPEKTDAAFYNLLTTGLMVRVTAYYESVTYQLYLGKIEHIRFPVRRWTTEPFVEIVARDPMLQLLDAEFKPMLLTNVRTDAAIREVFDAGVVTWPYEESYFWYDVDSYNDDKFMFDSSDVGAILNFDQGKTTLEYAGTTVGNSKGVSAQGYIRDMLQAELGGRFYWDCRQGKFVFHNRWRDSVNFTVDLTLNANINDGGYVYGEEITNHVVVSYTPQRLENTVKTLHDSDPLAEIPAGTIREVSAAYKDPEAPDARVSGTEIVVTYTLTVTQDVVVEVIKGAQGATLVVDNQGIVPTTVTDIIVTGKPIHIYEQETLEVDNRASVRAYDLRTRMIDMKAVDDPDLLREYAGALVYAFAEPVARFENAIYSRNYTQNDMGPILQRFIGDGVRLIDGWTQHNRTYVIVGERHVVDPKARNHGVTWVLKPADVLFYFEYDTSDYDGPHILAF